MIRWRYLPVACALALLPSVAAGQDAPRRLVLAPGDTIVVTVEGSGRAVVLVPGLLGASYTYRHVVDALVADGHRTIIVEPLGMGASARPEDADYSLEAQALRVLAAMDSTDTDSAILVCHSVGGSICYRLALRAPDRVQGIVAINAGPDEAAATSGLRRAMKLAPLIRLLGSGTVRGKLRDGLRDNSADEAWVTDEVVQAYTAPFGDLGNALRGLRGMADAREPEALLPRLRDIEVPVHLLIGTGTGDAEVSDEDLDALRTHVRGLTVEHVEAAGQYIQEEAPAEVVEAVQALRDAIEDGAR